jgi:hypothetical protein
MLGIGHSPEDYSLTRMYLFSFASFLLALGLGFLENASRKEKG